MYYKITYNFTLTFNVISHVRLFVILFEQITQIKNSFKTIYFYVIRNKIIFFFELLIKIIKHLKYIIILFYFIKIKI